MSVCKREKAKVNLGDTRTLISEFPGATRWGIVGSIGGSWPQSDPFVCPSCQMSEELVVWADAAVAHRECFNCWHAQSVQLSLFLENL
jgi:hypothetical protein